MAAQPILRKSDDVELTLWMMQYLPKLISGINSSLVPLLFEDLETRSCSAVNAVYELYYLFTFFHFNKFFNSVIFISAILIVIVIDMSHHVICHTSYTYHISYIPYLPTGFIRLSN